MKTVTPMKVDQLEEAIEVSATDTIPVIDLSGFATREGRSKIAAEVHDACTSIGFFLIKGHGISKTVMESMFKASEKYFDLPINEREKHTNDFKRGFLRKGGQSKESYEISLDLPLDDPDVVAGCYLHGPNYWPGGHPWLQKVADQYLASILELGEKIERLFAIGLGIDEYYFVELCKKPTLHLRLMHYLEQPEEMRTRDLVIPAHTDYGMFTVLLQDPNGGLEIQRRDGTWVKAPQVEDSFVVNIGDMMEIWTNDLYVSTPHRVVGLSGRDRHSVPAFFAPAFNTSVECISSCLAPGEAAKHPPLLAGKYLDERLSQQYGATGTGKGSVRAHRMRASA